MGERRTLVGDWGKLKAADLVVVAPSRCGHTECRGILTHKEPQPSGRVCWRAQPDCQRGLYPETVAEHRVYLIDTGLKDSRQSPATVSKRKGVRA